MPVELNANIINTRLQGLHSLVCYHFTNTVGPLVEYSEGRQSLVMAYKNLEKQVDFNLSFYKDQIPLGVMSVFKEGAKIDVPIMFTSDAFALSWFINKVKHSQGQVRRVRIDESVYTPPEYRELMIERLHA